jgi:hypothetical protein
MVPIAMVAAGLVGAAVVDYFYGMARGTGSAIAGALNGAAQRPPTPQSLTPLFVEYQDNAGSRVWLHTSYPGWVLVRSGSQGYQWIRATWSVNPDFTAVVNGARVDQVGFGG